MNIIVAMLIILALPSLADAHSFKLDKYGCHNNGSLSVYECHSGAQAGKSWPNPGGQQAMLDSLKTPPPIPVLVLTGEATLTWTANPVEDRLQGYKLYWSIEPNKWQTPIILGNVTQVNLPCILKGATYFFQITAYNEYGESGPSNVVSKRMESLP